MAALAVELKPVKSSRIAEIGFDADQFTLYVRFPATKKNPAGAVCSYKNVSEELFDSLIHAESIGTMFGECIVDHPEWYPFEYVDLAADPVPAKTIEAQVSIIPDDPEALKTLAIATRAEATALTITTAEECEAASREVLRIREQRKLAIEKVNRIKIPATQAWQAACALFNEIDGRYAEAEKYLDGGILAYRAAERRRAAEEAAELKRKEDERLAAALREQKEQFERDQKAAEAEAKQRADELAKADAIIAEAQGAPAEVVKQIIENPLPVTVRHVAPPPLAFSPAPPPIVQQNIPKVAGLSYTTVYRYRKTDESLIPLTHEFYSLDEKKIDARVQSLKQHANIPGVEVYTEEVPIKRTAKKG